MKILPKSRKVDNYLKEPVVFYCKDCEKIVKVKPLGKKFVYRCAICGTKNVAFGTEKAIKNYYRYEDEAAPVPADNKTDAHSPKKAKSAEGDKSLPVTGESVKPEAVTKDNPAPIPEAK